MFKYGGFKLFLLKVFSGTILIGLGLVAVISLATHSPQDPGLGKLVVFGDTANFFGGLGALTSSILLFFL